MKNKRAVKQNSKPTHPRRGITLSLLVVPFGVVAWVVLWQFGFIASVVAWGIAAGAVWLYKLGAAQNVTKAVAPYIMAIILLGVVLAFLGGMVSDAWAAYTSKEIGGTGGFFSADFMSFVTANLTNGELWQSYAVDILISLAFTALGAGGVIYNLYREPSKDKGRIS